MNDCYKKTLLDKIYTHTIQPINGPNMWTKSKYAPMIPPTGKKQPGRPRKLRRLESDEIRDKETSTVKMRKCRMKKTCSHCKIDDHNKRSCPLIPRDKEVEVQLNTQTPTT